MCVCVWVCESVGVCVWVPAWVPVCVSTCVKQLLLHQVIVFHQTNDQVLLLRLLHLLLRNRALRSRLMHAATAAAPHVWPAPSCVSVACVYGGGGGARVSTGRADPTFRVPSFPHAVMYKRVDVICSCLNQFYVLSCRLIRSGRAQRWWARRRRRRRQSAAVRGGGGGVYGTAAGGAAHGGVSRGG